MRVVTNPVMQPIVKVTLRKWHLTPLGELAEAGVPGTCQRCRRPVRYLFVVRRWVNTPEPAGWRTEHRCHARN